jgi:DUF1009 family protein
MQDENLKSQDCLAIFAGRGSLPQILLDDLVKKNRHFILFLLASETYEIDYSRFNPIKIAYGEVERFLQILKENNAKELVFIGGVSKPNFSQLKVDKTGAILLAKIVANKILGDDFVIKTVLKFFEKRGLKILPINDFLDFILAKKGCLTQAKPSEEDLKEIALGKKAIAHFSKFDVGQSLVIAQKQIIAVEALEGTDSMIRRCETLRANGILVKLKKPKQSKKADLPTIGVLTVKNCAKSNIKGIAIQANSTLIIDKEAVIDEANEAGIFIVAI